MNNIDTYNESLIPICDNNKLSINECLNMTNIKMNTMNHCIKKDEIVNRDLAASGDFILIHNSSLYKYYGGAFIETCSSQNFDTEFVSRMIYIYNLTGYKINKYCKFYHIPHKKIENFELNITLIKQSVENDIFNKILNNSLEFNCREVFNMLYIDIKTKKILPNWKPWNSLYKRQNKNWGFPGVKFPEIVF